MNSKIDNFLAALVADSDIQLIFRRQFRRFLQDDEEEEDVIGGIHPLMHNDTTGASRRASASQSGHPQKLAKKATQTQLRVVQTGPRNYRLKSRDPTTNKSKLLPQSSMYSQLGTHTPFGVTPRSVTFDTNMSVNMSVNTYASKQRTNTFNMDMQLARKKPKDCVDRRYCRCRSP